jgi:hypothetical protein
MGKHIYLVGGSKGGVGKSIVTMALIDFLQQHQEPVLLVESDTSNPDVWKAYKDSVSTELVNLDEADGWVRFVNICEKAVEQTVVVNTAARNNQGVGAYGGTLGASLGELQRRLVTFWVINRQRDSLELLKEYIGAMPDSEVHVVRNAYFGEAAKFELYEGSNIKKTLEGRGGKSVTFPDLADRVCDDLYSSRLTIAGALEGPKKLPLGNRAELTRWRGEVAKVFEGLVNG